MPKGRAAVRALVIDYTPEIVQLVRTVLRTMNGIDHVDSTARGDVAANLLDRNDYDVVILEPVVPHGEEHLLAYLMRSRPTVCRRTIIMSASPVAPAMLKEIARAKVWAAFDKPFDVVAFSEAVRSCVDISPARPALRCEASEAN